MPLFSGIEWGPGRKDDFVAWIRNQIYQTEGDREDLERTWENALLMWRAKVTDEELNYPYPSASNLELPLVAMHSDPVYADMMQSFHAAEDYWTPTAKRPDRAKDASALREGMTALERRFLKMRNVNGRAFLDNNILGTAFYKNGWRSETRARRVYLPDGESRRETRLVSQPFVSHVPIQRFWFPASAWSLDFDAPGGAPWVAEEFRWTRTDFEVFRKGSSELPGFDDEAADAVANFFVDEEEPIRRITESESEFEPFEHVHLKAFEVWARFDVSGEGVYEDICVVFHPQSGRILRGIYFPNAHGRHPFHGINYLPGYGIYGIGLAEVDEWAQEASTQLLNAQIDNARLANTRMFTAPQGSQFQQDELVYPGKVWYVGPDEQIGEVRLSEVYPSGFNLMSQLVQFAEMRSGVSELRQGSISGLPSRTPATSLLSILQEGNKRFDMIHSGIREVHSEIGLRMLQNVAQRAKEDPFTWQTFFAHSLGPEDAARVMGILGEADVESIEEAFGVAVSATSGRVNKEVEKQSFIGMLQIAQQIYGSLIETAMMRAQIPDPVVQATAAASYASGVDILSQLFDRFDIQNKQEHLGALESVAAQLNAEQEQQAGGASGMGGMGAPGANGAAFPQNIDPAALASIFGL